MKNNKKNAFPHFLWSHTQFQQINTLVYYVNKVLNCFQNTLMATIKNRLAKQVISYLNIQNSNTHIFHAVKVLLPQITFNSDAQTQK